MRDIPSLPNQFGAAPVLLTAPTATSHHPNGFAHVRSTVRKMADLATDEQDIYSVRNLATRITHGVPSKAPRAELQALYEWVRDHIRYRKDPVGTEWVQRPTRTVAERAGDCDDMATLLAALAGALGHRWRFRTVGPSPMAQAHVAVQAHDGNEWVELDPVLEPSPPTTQPRPGVAGRFGGAAVGADHLWDAGGRMLSGVATAKDRELWLFSAYYGGSGTSDGGPIAPGTPATPDPRYRSPDAPGFYQGKPKMLALPAGAVPDAAMSGLGGVYYDHPELGLGFLKKLGKIVRKVTKLPGVDIAAGLIPGGSTVLTAAKAVTGGGGKRKRRKKRKRRRAPRRAAAPRRRAAAPAAGGGAPANYVTRTDIRDMRADIMQLADLAKRSDIERLALLLGARAAKPKRKRKRKRKRRAAAAAKPRRVRRRRSKRLRARPALRRGLPKDARQLFDRQGKVFRVYGKKRRGRRSSARKLSGVGALRPTLSLSFGAVGAWDPSSALSLAARDAARAVNRFIARAGKPPAIRMAQVRAFQEAEPGLKADGLWGPNTQAAARYYLDGSGTAIPRHAPGFRGPVTWAPPSAPAPAAVVAQPQGPPPPLPAPPPAPALPPPPPPAPPVAVAPPPPPAPPPVVVAPPAPKLRPPQTIVIAPPPPAPPAPPGYVQLAVSSLNPGVPPVGWEPTPAQRKDADTIARDTLRRAGVPPASPDYPIALQRQTAVELERMRTQASPPAPVVLPSRSPGRPTQVAAFPGSPGGSSRGATTAPATAPAPTAARPAFDSHPGLPLPDPHGGERSADSSGSDAPLWLAVYLLWRRSRAA